MFIHVHIIWYIVHECGGWEWGTYQTKSFIKVEVPPVQGVAVERGWRIHGHLTAIGYDVMATPTEPEEHMPI